MAVKIVADANIPFVKECFSSIGDVEVVSGGEITAERVAKADVLLVRSVTKVNEKLLAGSKVRFVGTATIGFDHVDIDFLKKNNIGFASAPGSNANSVAEYVIAALLEIGKKHKVNLKDKTMGVIGVGNVGSKVVIKTEALGMRTFLNDPPLARKTGDTKYRPLEDIFDCDFITLHVPLTFDGVDKTHYLADEKFFDSLKKNCIFINTSRGGVVNTSVLKKAINSGKLKSVVLDVWENEPNIDIELLQKVDIATPHIAGYSYDGKVAGMIMIYKSVCEYFGLKANFNVNNFLPAPAVPQLQIGKASGDEQETLRQIVEKIYDIKKDDANMRSILNRPAEKRGEFFSRLRKEYPIRREFQNTTITLVEEMSSVSKRLKGIGFKVANGQKH